MLPPITRLESENNWIQTTGENLENLQSQARSVHKETPILDLDDDTSHTSNHPTTSNHRDGLRFDPSTFATEPGPLFELEDNLPDLDELLRALTPCTLQIIEEEQDLVIRGSHSPSLKWIERYFETRWLQTVRKPSFCEGATDMGNGKGSDKGDCGVVADNVTIRHCTTKQAESSGKYFLKELRYHEHVAMAFGEHNYGDRTAADPHMFLAFVQGVLGYRLLSMERGSWYFQRNGHPSAERRMALAKSGQLVSVAGTVCSRCEEDVVRNGGKMEQVGTEQKRSNQSNILSEESDLDSGVGLEDMPAPSPGPQPQITVDPVIVNNGPMRQETRSTQRPGLFGRINTGGSGSSTQSRKSRNKEGRKTVDTNWMAHAAF
jgi:hypothetical protein